MVNTFCVSILAIGIGLLSLFAKDFMWELTVWGNQMKGQASERTEWWEITTTLSGLFFLIVGIGLLVMAFMGGAGSQ
ncbi:MAG: hypothetical protein U0401_25370 [Anaerolineae bacterium]